MTESPGKLSQFWQELKRRKVIKVIAVYAGAAYVIIELVNNVTEPLSLPLWTPTLVILLLAIGFPVAVIFSWIFDVTPEGVKKTESLEDVRKENVQEEDSQPPPPRRILKASNIIIGLLLVAVCILLYPRIFQPDQFKELRDDEGMISVAVLPFNNLTGDSSLYHWQNGISELLIDGLAQSDELAVSSSHVVLDVLSGTKQVYSASISPEIARRTASKISASTHITGNYIGSGKDVSIVMNLVNTEKGDLIWTARVDGDLETNFRNLIDRLSDTVRNYMEIKALEDKVETDLSNAFPNSAEAYRFYIDGLNNIVAGNYKLAIESLEMAYHIDSTFTFAAFYLAFAHNFAGGDLFAGHVEWVRRAHELKNNLPPAYRPWIDLWYAGSITRDFEDLRRYCDIMYEAAIHSRFLLFDLGVTYTSFFDDYDKAINAFKKVEELNRRWEDDWIYDRYYNEYTEVLLLANQLEEVLHISDIGLMINPKNDNLVRKKGAAAILMNDSVAVQQYREDFMTLAKENGYSEAATEYRLGNMHRWGKDYGQAADHYRRSNELDREDQGSIIGLVYSQLRGNLNFEECLRLSEYGLEQDPESTYFLWGKGFSLHKLGRDQEALAILLPLKERYPFNREIQRDFQEVEQALARK